MRRRRDKDLRCFCRNEPLLATYGIDSRGKLFVHVKVYKGNRLYHESVFYEGVIKIRCRNCFRWHGVIFRPTIASLSETEAPESQTNEGRTSMVLDAPEYDR